MARQADQAILDLIESRGGSLRVYLGNLAKQAKLSNCKIIDIRQALERLVRAGKITCSVDRMTGQYYLRLVRVRA